MILNEHQASRMERRIDTAGCIGQEKYFGPHHLHQSCRQYHVRDWIPLIIMYPALHQNYGNLINIAKDKLPGMSRHCGNRKALDLAVGKFRLHIHDLREVAEARA